jgi:kinesin family protein 4/21/27
MSSPGGSVTSYGVHKSFVFDQAFPPETKQKHIFQQCIEPLVGACLSGYNATVLAYGQTGSGKTYTILGPSTEGIFAEDGVSASQAGVIPRALRDLFDKLEAFKKQRRSSCDGVVGSMSEGGGSNSIKRSENPYQYEVRVQYLELYGEEIRDLLNSSGNKLVIRDGGGGVEPEVIGASEVKVNSAEEALLCLMRGTLRRVTGATAMNSESSRSHAIMTVIVEQTTVMRPGSAGSVMSAGSDRSSGNTDIETKRSKFHFVDLAGSERQKRSLAQGQRLKEGIDINKGLLVLGNVISALGDPKKQGKVFVPYRDSKLTRLLKGSLGGNHKTLMIACVSPSSINLEESLNCLRYANRAKNIQNNAIINLDAGSKLVAELRSQIQALARELLEYQEKSGDDSSKVFKIDVLRALANGVDSSNMNFGSANGMSNSYPSQKVEVDEEIIMRFKAEIEKLKSVTKQLEQDLAIQSEELFAARAETEYYRLMRQEGGSDEQMSAEEVRGKESFVNRVKDYEREVANLRNQLRDIRAQSALSVHSSPSQRGSELNIAPSSPSRSSSYNNDSPATPKSGRNRSLIKVSSPFPTTDKDDEEDKEIQKITQKYLKVGQQEVGVIDDEEDEEDVDNKVVNGTIDEEDEEETFTSRQSIISSHVVQLTRGIAAKQELITKLEQSQLKYEVSCMYLECFPYFI